MDLPEDKGHFLNTERTSIELGWNMIHPSTAYGSASINSWSSAQSIGFPFSFYGSSATHFCVSKNYLLTFDTTVAGTPVNSSITTDNTALPHANLPDHTIAYFGVALVLRLGATIMFGGGPLAQLPTASCGLRTFPINMRLRVSVTTL